MREKIRKAALFVERDGRILLCRRREGSQLLILPGGKLEAGETAEEALQRELREELGKVEVDGLYRVGRYEGPAAGAMNKVVVIELFGGKLRGEARPCAEIGELVWFGAGDDEGRLAPSLRDSILPDLRARGLLPEKG
ncbi:MAG: NUDIX domain-containing protein [Bryobacteraceae bacterium]|nr:NUDIX domain-containing protein [Bryobacteraceae bacterium]